MVQLQGSPIPRAQRGASESQSCCRLVTPDNHPWCGNEHLWPWGLNLLKKSLVRCLRGFISLVFTNFCFSSKVASLVMHRKGCITPQVPPKFGLPPPPCAYALHVGWLFPPLRCKSPMAPAPFEKATKL